MNKITQRLKTSYRNLNFKIADTKRFLTTVAVTSSVAVAGQAHAIDAAEVATLVAVILAGIAILGAAGLSVHLAVQAWKKGRQAFS
jgi:hypothetical protein